MISIILPAYNEEAMLLSTAQTIAKLLQEAATPYELIFIDDGSKDCTWERIQEAAQKDPHVLGLQFSRNFGKEAAIFAGLAQAKGDACVVMDCDLQHPPETLLSMIALWESGYEIVNGVKEDRGKEPRSYRFAAKLFNRIMSRLTKFDFSHASDFKLLDRHVVDSLLELNERRTFFRGLVPWTGFRSTDLPFKVQERAEGESSFSTPSLIRYAVSNISAFSSAPLHLVTLVGGVFFIAAILLGIQTLVRWFQGTAADGFTTVILLLLFIGAMLMISLGIIGYYISQIYIEMKERPRYFISQQTPFLKEDNRNG